MYLDTGFVIAPLISESVLIGSQDMAHMDNILQSSTTPMYRDLPITPEPYSTATSILEQVINSYIYTNKLCLISI